MGANVVELIPSALVPSQLRPCLPTHLCLPARVFAGAVAEGGIVKGIRVPDGQAVSNSRVKPKGDVSSERAARMC